MDSTTPLFTPATATEPTILSTVPAIQQAIEATTSLIAPATQQDQPKRKRRTNEEMALERAEKEAKRLAKEKARAEKEVEQKAKQIKKAVRLKMAEQAKMEKQQRFIWSDLATADLLDMVLTLRNEHETINQSVASFVPWSRFFKDHSDRKNNYESLKLLSHDTLDRRYKALLTAYRTIRGSGAATGDGGLPSQLQRYHISQATYDAIDNYHANHNMIQAVGGADAQDVAVHHVNDVMDLSVSDLADTTVTSVPEWSRSSDDDQLESSIAPSRTSAPLLSSDLTAAIPSESSMPKPPGDVQDQHSGCACRLEDILNEINKSREAFTNGLAALLLMQQEAHAQSEARADQREARAVQREEQMARLEEARENRRLEWEQKRDAEREERRRQNEARQQLDQEARAQERENSKMMQMMMMGILSKVTGTGDQNKLDNC